VNTDYILQNTEKMSRPMMELTGFNVTWAYTNMNIKKNVKKRYIKNKYTYIHARFNNSFSEEMFTSVDTTAALK